MKVKIIKDWDNSTKGVYSNTIQEVRSFNDEQYELDLRYNGSFQTVGVLPKENVEVVEY